MRCHDLIASCIRHVLLIAVASALTAPSSELAAEEPALHAAAAAVELRAEDEMHIGGGIFPTVAKGQDGMLRVVATVIQGPPQKTRVAIIACDVLMIERKYLDEAARLIEQKTGIPFDNILINCTHTHHAPSTVKVHAYDLVPEFAEQVRDAIVSAAVAASEKLVGSQPVAMHYKMGREETVGQNSRIELADGTIYWTGPREDAVRPTGPFDPDFPVLAFRGREGGGFSAVIFGHSTHTIGTRTPGHRSPAFYGLAAQSFEQETGAVTTFIQGASGSTHFLGFPGVPFPQAWHEAERRILNALRYTVDQAPRSPVGHIAALRREVTVKVRTFDEAAEHEAVSEYCTKRLAAPHHERIIATFKKMRDELAPYQGEERRTWVQAIRIGDVAIVGVPAEFFTQLGLDIKARSPFPGRTIIAELANDYIGYVGNADAYRLGGYQLWMGYHSWTERGAGELLVDSAVELLHELHGR